MDSGDGYTGLRMYLMVLNCTLKMVRLVIFRLYIFYYDYFLKSGNVKFIYEFIWEFIYKLFHSSSAMRQRGSNQGGKTKFRSLCGALIAIGKKDNFNTTEIMGSMMAEDWSLGSAKWRWRGLW